MKTKEFMKVSELGNYGCSLDDMVNKVPEDFMKVMKQEFKKEMSQSLGIIGTFKFLIAKRKLDKLILNKENDIANELDISNVNFVKYLLNRATGFGALCKVVGKEETLKMYFKLADKCTYDFMKYLNPNVEELEACGDPFEVFKEYMRAGLEANADIGIHKFEEVEETDDIYRFNITDCAFYSVPDKIGLRDACLSSCYGDEVFYPKYCDQFGVEFIRKNTIARGDKVCD